jgi:hypothetical protein
MDRGFQMDLLEMGGDGGEHMGASAFRGREAEKGREARVRGR